MKRGCVRLAAAVVALGAMNLQAISIQEEIDAAAAKGGGLVVVHSGLTIGGPSHPEPAYTEVAGGYDDELSVPLASFRLAD